MTHELRPGYDGLGGTSGLGGLWAREGRDPTAVYLGLETGCQREVTGTAGSGSGSGDEQGNSNGGELVLGPTPEQAAQAAVPIVPFVLGLETLACEGTPLQECFSCIEPHYGGGRIGVPGFSVEDLQVRPTSIVWDATCPGGRRYEPR